MVMYATLIVFRRELRTITMLVGQVMAPVDLILLDLILVTERDHTIPYFLDINNSSPILPSILSTVIPYKTKPLVLFTSRYRW